MVLSLPYRETESLLMEITCPESTGSEIEQGIQFRLLNSCLVSLLLSNPASLKTVFFLICSF